MRKTMRKALSLILVVTLLMSMACISGIGVGAAAKSYKMGDVNMDGAVDIRDATLIQQYLADLETLSDIQLYLADVDGEPGVSVKDATYIMQGIADLIEEHATNPDGKSLNDEVTFDEDPIPSSSSSASEATTNPQLSDDYYLVGYINGADYGTDSDAENQGDKKFVNGHYTMTFKQESYVAVKSSDGTTYFTDGWLGKDVTSAVLAPHGVYAEDNKLYV
ncbi:MAG: dockerin type I repeat-containing protein, partial [Ruminococcus sp.]|nr:dockerin type I repeat-containing protein [Ruminococcus sp.]